MFWVVAGGGGCDLFRVRNEVPDPVCSFPVNDLLVGLKRITA